MDVVEEQVNKVLEKPDKAVRLSDEQLDAVMLAAIGRYGATADLVLVKKLMTLYLHYVTRIHPAKRLSNYQSIVDQVISGKYGAHALMPFVCCDPARIVACPAALDYIVLAPTEKEKASVAACELLDLYERGALANGVAVLGGLIMSGDRRILPLLTQACRSLSCDEVEILIKCRAAHLTAAVVEFYLEWLESLDSAVDTETYDTVAAGLANLAIGASDGTVYDIERVIPSTPDNAVHVLNQWPLSEYADKIASRLENIAKREQGEPVMPEVLSIWGLA